MMNWPVSPTSNIAEHMDVLFGYALKATTVLEIGCETGRGSTMAFDEAMRCNCMAKKFVSVDIADCLARRPTFERWKLVVGDSRKSETVDAVMKECDGIVAFDLIFIDTIHTYEQMKAELAVWVKLSHFDTVWLFHDTWMHGRYNHMTDAIKEFAESSDGAWEYSDLSKACHGLGKMERPK